jgi:hypothetical protein
MRLVGNSHVKKRLKEGLNLSFVVAFVMYSIKRAVIASKSGLTGALGKTLKVGVQEA